MKKQLLGLILLLVLSSACSKTTTTGVPVVVPPTSSPTPIASSPKVEGPDPSYKVAAFYYPWYGDPQTDGHWIHWEEPNFHPPQDISSDYYPALGAYSSYDPAVVEKHMAWLRNAGIGVIITSWWGPGTNEDGAVPLILQMAERYGIKVAIHIEPYNGRTADALVSDVKYIYQKYWSSPAFFRSNASTRYSPNDKPKGMFFVWCIEFIGECGKQPAQAEYWQKALDEIHALPEGALVIANTQQGSWVGSGHFDGLYNYFSMSPADFAWASSLPPDSLYIPSVAPGFSGKRIADPPDTFMPRNDGITFAQQWKAALGTGIQPDMVTITSFNEWHEGTMIEPPAVGANNGIGYTYADFGKLPPDGYLTLTHQWIDKFLSTTWPAVYRVRIKIVTTSDWTTLNIVSGGGWIRPELISASQSATEADMDGNGRLSLLQPLNDANKGKQVEMIWDMQLSGLDPTGDLTFEIDRGNLGVTRMTLYNYIGDKPIQVKDFNWGGVTTGRNADRVSIPIKALITTKP